MAEDGGTFGEVMETAMDEGVKGWMDENPDASGDEGYTVEQMREQLGDDAKDISDDDLTKMWEDTKVEVPEGEAEVKEGEEKVDDVSTDFHFKDEEAFLAHTQKSTINGQEVNLSVADYRRMAQRTPMLEQQTVTLRQQRTELAQENATVKHELDQLRQDAKYWRWVLQDEEGKRFLDARAKFQETMMAGGPEEKPDATPASGYTPEQEALGEQYYEQNLRSTVQAMARSYSLDGGVVTPEHVQYLEGEIKRLMTGLIDEEGSFLTNQRLEDIFQYDLPDRITRGGDWKPIKGAASSALARTSGLNLGDWSQPVGEAGGQENTALRAEIANLKTERAKAKVRGAPNAGGGSVPGAGTGDKSRLDGAKSFSDVIDALQDTDESFGL